MKRTFILTMAIFTTLYAGSLFEKLYDTDYLSQEGIGYLIMIIISVIAAALMFNELDN